ncbi:acyltransferase [Rothia nasimurium]|uniref:acyltransferase n=1 Tax=Rothia nasimurium TaxID=85336 RepID=UPI001F367AEA|nr:acyltransferase [Rothia nasimurium]
MNIARILTEVPASIRWHVGSVFSRVLYSNALGSSGKSLKIISPLKIVGTENMYFGKNVLIREGAWLQTEAGGCLRIGNHFHLGHYGHLHAVADITIGDGCLFGDNVMINTGVHTPGNLSQITHRGPIHIGNNVFLGRNVIVLGGVTIGDGSTVGAGAIVTKDVPAGAVVAGVPAKSINRK